MNVGQSFMVYQLIKRGEERCNLGHLHEVPTYRPKRIWIFQIVPEFITALHYTHDGIGDVLYAQDAQGRVYRKEPHWDGPRATGWVCEGRYFDQYPSPRPSRDVTGRMFTP